MTKVKDNKGGRPKLADYQKRTKLVRIMFCENDFIYIQSKASKAGLSVSEYCHQAAMDNHIRETISPELAKQIRDLSGIANNVNQIAAHPTNPVEGCADANPKTMLPNDT